MCGHCKADDATVCEDCGVLVADGYQQQHRRQHPHPYESYPNGEWGPTQGICLMCRLPASADVHAKAPEPGTPAHAHLLQRHADDESARLAWRHDCGHLVQGFWTAGAYCRGCGMDADDAGDVTAHYRLVPVEGLSGEGRG